MRTIGPMLALCFLASGASAQGWVGGAPYSSRVLVDGSGEVYVGVWVDAPPAIVAQARTPMAVSLVIDTSGSMAGDKIENARRAASSLLESLADGDMVSLYGFSDIVTELTAPTVLSPINRSLLLQRVSMLEARGATNMWDAMQVAVQRISQAPPSHMLRRIFLISDGRANVGPSDAQSLGDLSARATEWGTQVTTIGVGVDYDYQTLGAMAVRSSGRVYHLEDSRQMASILEQELRLLSQSVARNAYLEITPAPGVTILEGMTVGSQVQDGRLRFSLGALFGGQRRELLLRARLDTARLGSQPLATARLVYELPDRAGELSQTDQLRYEVTRDRRAVDASQSPRVVAMVTDIETARAEQRAAELMAQGQQLQAAAVLQQAQRQVASFAASAPPAASPRVQSQAHALEAARQEAERATTPAAQRATTYNFSESSMTVQGMGAPMP